MNLSPQDLEKITGVGWQECWTLSDKAAKWIAFGMLVAVVLIGAHKLGLV